MPYGTALNSKPLRIEDCAGSCGAAVSGQLREAGISDRDAFEIGCSVEALVRGLLLGVRQASEASLAAARESLCLVGQHEEESE